MSIRFNHTILAARDAEASSDFLAQILSLPEPTRWGPFWMVTTDNDANLDYMNVEHAITPQHYAFLVDEQDFDDILERLVQKQRPYWADPQKRQHGINRHDGGRGLYFEDPNGHLMELITRPYGSGGWEP
ncbi:VOC family protein [uncultured Nitratireductor sp.]|uniref:VOC family protein n=1 Tax=uncultured Nitratireductor sp. TaxID=520953 RepID=UPI0025CD3120|nr:VOC family protein [uncultured Nitratireductor sp.]